MKRWMCLLLVLCLCSNPVVLAEEAVPAYRVLLEKANQAHKEGKPHKAVSYAQEALDSCIAERGEYDRAVLSVIDQISTWLFFAHRLAEEKPYIDRALNIVEKISGTDSPDYTRRLNDLADYYVHIGDYNAAEDLYEEVIKRYKKHYENNYDTLGSIFANISNHYKMKKEYKKECAYLEEALDVLKKAPLEGGERMLIIKRDLADNCIARGKTKEAEALLEEILNSKINTDDAKSIQFEVVGRKAEQAFQSGNYEVAEKMFLRMLQESPVIYASAAIGSPLDILPRIAMHYQAQNQGAKGIALYEAMFNILSKRRDFSTQGWDYLSLLHGYAQLTKEVKGSEAALPLYLEYYTNVSKYYPQAITSLPFLNHNITNVPEGYYDTIFNTILEARMSAAPPGDESLDRFFKEVIAYYRNRKKPEKVWNITQQVLTVLKKQYGIGDERVVTQILENADMLQRDGMMDLAEKFLDDEMEQLQVLYEETDARILRLMAKKCEMLRAGKSPDKTRKAYEEYSSLLERVQTDPADAERMRIYPQLIVMYMDAKEYDRAKSTQAQLDKLKEKWGAAPLPVGTVLTAPTNDQVRLWALAMSAVLTERNGRDHIHLSGMETISADAQKKEQAFIEEWWGITNREELLNTFVSLEKYGQRSEYVVYEKILAVLSPEEIETLLGQRGLQEDVRHRLLFIKNNQAELKDKNLFVLDMVRYILLCRWGYVAGYLTEEEAWQRILPAAVALRDTCSSWEEMGRQYVMGRTYWSKSQTEEDKENMDRTWKKLTEDPSSPWRTIPWHVAVDPIDTSRFVRVPDIMKADVEDYPIELLSFIPFDRLKTFLEPYSEQIRRESAIPIVRFRFSQGLKENIDMYVDYALENAHGDLGLQANLYYIKADIRVQDKKYAAAIEQIEKSIEIYQQRNEYEYAAGCSLYRALWHEALGQFKEARAVYDTIVSWGEKKSGRAAFARAILGRVAIHIGSGEMSKQDAMEEVEKANKIFDELGAEQGRIMCIIIKGDIEEFHNEYDEALRHNQEALARSEKTSDKKLVALTMLTQGMIYKKKKDYAKALELVRAAEMHATEASFLEVVLSAKIEIGRIYFLETKIKEAEAAWTGIDDYVKKVEKPIYTARYNFYLSELLDVQKKNAESRAAYKRAKESYHEMGYDELFAYIEKYE